MKETKISTLKELKNVDFTNVVKVTFDSVCETYNTQGSMVLDETEEGPFWLLTTADTRRFTLSTSRFAKSDAEALIKAQLKTWGVNPSTVKWETSSPETWEENFAGISAREQSFFYSKWGKGTDRTQLLTSYTVSYDNRIQTYYAARERILSGSLEEVRKLFIKFLKSAPGEHVITVYEY